MSLDQVLDRLWEYGRNSLAAGVVFDTGETLAIVWSTEVEKLESALARGHRPVKLIALVPKRLTGERDRVLGQDAGVTVATLPGLSCPDPAKN